jgi:acyl-coenzyme A thioesterase PaaI-like protein
MSFVPPVRRSIPSGPVTDLPAEITAVPARLGTRARVDERGLVVELEPQPGVLHHGVVRSSVVAYLVDVVSGVSVDSGDDVWTFTTDMTVRMLPVPAPGRLVAVNDVLRRGRRSVTCAVSVTDDRGALVASGAIGFAHVPRKPDDPPKIHLTPQEAVHRFGTTGLLSEPLRDEAGIVVLDAPEGIVEITVRPEVCNPAGTLQGAMVALVAESAAEDLVAHRLGVPVTVVDLDVRYLAQAKVGPVRTRCRVMGEWVRVELVDTAADRVSTLVYARAVPVAGIGS